MSVEQSELVPGLAGVPAAESAVSYIDGVEGILEYRGFPIEVLAERSHFEEVAWLLIYGDLPTERELEGFKRRLAEYRRIPDSLVGVLRALPREGHPMDALQAGLAALAMCVPRVRIDDAASSEEAMFRVLASTGTIIGTFERSRRGLDWLEPDPALGTAGNFLRQITDRTPDELSTRVLDTALVLHADHTMNASTFAMRVVASTETDPYTACSAAVGALEGPLHGGANERVVRQLEAIGGPQSVETWVEEAMSEKRKIMGFGHRVYKTKDPRAKILQGLTRELFRAKGSSPIYDTALALEEAVVSRLGAKGIYPNVDFFSGILYSKLGVPTDLFTPIFAISRVAGYVAHWREQMASNRLFRPAQVFVGHRGADWVPLADR